MNKKFLPWFLCCTLVAGTFTLLWTLDKTRAGPISDLEKCNFLLATSKNEPADILIVGSSRIAVAIDPVAMQDMLHARYPHLLPTVERIVIPISPLRPTKALFERYVETRGAPKILVYDIPFLTARAVKNLELNHKKPDAEDYIFTRDMGLLSFNQIINMSSIAMPFSREENIPTQIHLVLRGLLLRSSMLIFEFFQRPLRDWTLDSCNVQAWRVGGMSWPVDFEFSYAHSHHNKSPSIVIEEYAQLLLEQSGKNSLADWQLEVQPNETYPYDFESDYRKGELQIFQQIVKLAKVKDIKLIIQPLTLFGTKIKKNDQLYLESLGEGVTIYNPYSESGNLLDTNWYDSAHIKLLPAGIYTTALTAEHIVQNRFFESD